MELTDKDEQRLVKEIDRLCKINGVDPKLIDIFHEIDRQISYSENMTELKQKFQLWDEDDVRADQERMLRQHYQTSTENLEMFRKIRPRVVCILGDSDSGKTAIAHRICDEMRNAFKMPVYTFRHKKPELIRKIAYGNIIELGEVDRMNNFILYLDEPQVSLPRYDAKNNDTLLNLISIIRHKDSTLVISTNDTRWVNRALESYVDFWVIKDINPVLVKQGSVVKHIIKNFCPFSIEGFKLMKNEFLFSSRVLTDYENTKHTFQLPKYWSEEFSKPYSGAK